MKKSVILFCVFLLLCNFVASSDLNDLQDSLEDKVDKVAETKEQIEDKKWNYLDEKWQGFLQENKVMQSVDGFLRKINSFFVFLLGEDYELSLVFFLSVFLWIFFFLNFKILLKPFLSSGWSWVLAFGGVFVVRILNGYFFLSNLILSFVFSKEGIWSFILFFVLLVVFAFLYMLNKIMAKKSEEEQEKTEKEMAKLDRGFLHKLTRSFSFGTGRE